MQTEKLVEEFEEEQRRDPGNTVCFKRFLDEWVEMENGELIPRCMIGYRIPYDEKRYYKAPRRRYISASQLWDEVYPLEPARESRLAFAKAKWMGNHPGEDPKKFSSKNLTMEEQDAYLQDPRWARVRELFLYKYTIDKHRRAWFLSGWETEREPPTLDA